MLQRKEYWPSGKANILPLFTKDENGNCFSIYTLSDLQIDEKETIEIRFNWRLNLCVEIIRKTIYRIFKHGKSIFNTCDKILVTVQKNGILISFKSYQQQSKLTVNSKFSFSLEMKIGEVVGEGSN